MKFGFQLPTGREGLSLPTPFFQPRDFVTSALTAESLGYDSLWANDHYCAPNYVRKLVTSVPNYWELLTILTAAAAVTQRIELGTSALVLPMRDPVAVARQVATLDQLSGGRVLLGVGLGNYREEMAAAYPERMGLHRARMAEEALELMGKLFTENGVTFKGRYYHVENLDLAPKPVRRPFPFIIGGHHKNALDRTVKYGQGWIPGWHPVDELRELIGELKQKAAQAGRDPESLIIAPHFTCLVARTQEEAEQRYMNSGVVHHRISQGYSAAKLASAMQHNLIGCPENLLAKIEALEAAGVTHIAALSLAVDTVGEFSEQVHRFAEEVMRPYRASRARVAAAVA